MEINWQLLVATLAFTISILAFCRSIKASKNQALTFIMTQLDKRAIEANTVVYNYQNLHAEHILSMVLSIIISANQILTLLCGRYSKYIKLNDRSFILEQFYLSLHTIIRSQLWTIDEKYLSNDTLKTQLRDCKKLLSEFHDKWD